MTVAILPPVEVTGGTVPDWVHLLPAGAIRTVDGRGPYRVQDVAALMSASITVGKLPLDENHATDLAAPQGREARARGWIVELQNRADGVWGRVEWTSAGRQIMEDRAYRGVSPVIAARPDGTISAILRASLTNTPNLTGLASLHSAQLGGDDDADQLDAVDLAVIEKLGVDRADYVATRRAARRSDGAPPPPAAGATPSEIERRVRYLLGLDRLRGQ